MIEQIKQAVENREGSFDMRNEYLLYLIGEVERLEYEKRHLEIENAPFREMQKQAGKLYYENVALRSRVEEMQKTLEWYADHTNYDPYRFMGDNGKRARETIQALKEDKPNGNSSTV